MRILATAAIVAAILVSGWGQAEIAAGQVVLNCEIEEGAAEGRTTQIMIDEPKGFVIYDFQYHNSSEPTRTVDLGDGSKGEVNFSMKITINNGNLIMADDHAGAFIITKHDARFVRAFVVTLPSKDGHWVAVGNVHWGTCAKTRFD